MKSKINHLLISVCLLISLLGLSSVSFGQALHWLSKPQSQLGPILNGRILDSKISANGRFILLRSDATNIVANTNVSNMSFGQLYLYDRLNDTVKWVDEPFGQLDFFRIDFYSAPTSDGTLMAFIYRGDIGFGTDRFDEHLYTMNLVTNEIKLITQDTNGIPFEASSTSFVLTDDGNKLYFTTRTQLLPEHTNATNNIYQIDLNTDQFSLISVSNDNTQAGTSTTRSFSVSPSGRYVSFNSASTNLVAETVTGTNLYLRDTQSLTTQLITVQPSGQASMVDESDGLRAVSNLGTVVFLSDKSDLVSGDDNQKRDLFLYENGANTRINLGENGSELSDSRPGSPHINAAGNLIFFVDDYPYTAADMDDSNDIYQFNINTDTFTLIEPQIGVIAPSLLGISADGQQILIDGFGGEVNQNTSLSHAFFGGTFVTNTVTGMTEQIEPVAQAPETIISGVGNLYMSSDQRYAVFSSSSPNLSSPVESDNTVDTFYYDRLLDDSVKLGHLTNSQAISPNGRYVVLSSFFFQPEGMIEAGSNLYLHDTISGSYSQIASGSRAQVNDLGLVVFETPINLIPADNNGVSDIYLFDANNNSINLLSQSANGDIGNALSERAYINNDNGLTSVVFASDANNLIPADINDRRDVFMVDWPSGSITRVSQTTAQVGGNGFSYLADISNDGQTIAFASSSNNLTNANFNGLVNIFLYDRASQNITLVSKDDKGEPLSSDFFDLNISDAGNFITFSAQRDIEFLEGDNSSSDFDVFMIDVNTEAISLISQPLDGADVYVESFRSKVYEDLSQSPPRVGVSFIANSTLTGYFNHPGYDEAFLYQQGGPNVLLNLDVVGTGSVGGSFGLSCMTSCDFDYALGTEINLIASPAPGYVFDRWSSSRGQCTDENNPCMLLMDQDKQIKAVFIDPNEVIFEDGFQ